MTSSIIIKLRRMIKQNFKLFVLMLLFSHQFEVTVASGFGSSTRQSEQVKPTKSSTPAAEKVSAQVAFADLANTQVATQAGKDVASSSAL